MKREKYLKFLKQSLLQEKMILLLGARQVGKTTIMQQFQEEIKDTTPTLYISIEDHPEIWHLSSKKWIEWVKVQYGFDMSSEGIIFMDEIQVLNSPEIFLKTIYDNTTIKTKIIATGSRFWGQKVVGGSLIGRGKQIRISTFDIYEFLEVRGKHINNTTPYEWIEDVIKEYLMRGGYPAVVFAETLEMKKEQYKRVIDRLYEKDFIYALKQSELPATREIFLRLTQNIGNIAKLETIASYSGTTAFKVKQILQFLQDSYLITPIYPYNLDRTKEISQKPKYYFHDIGIISYIQGGYDQSQMGKIIENYVYQQIVAQKSYDKLSFYKTLQGGEVDLVLSYNKDRYWIESKSGDSLTIPKIMNYLPKSNHDHYIKTTKTISDTIQKDITCTMIPYRDIGHYKDYIGEDKLIT